MKWWKVMLLCTLILGVGTALGFGSAMLNAKLSKGSVFGPAGSCVNSVSASEELGVLVGDLFDELADSDYYEYADVAERFADDVDDVQDDWRRQYGEDSLVELNDRCVGEGVRR